MVACAGRPPISRADGIDSIYAFAASGASRYGTTEGLADCVLDPSGHPLVRVGWRSGDEVMDELSVYFHGIVLAYTVALLGLMSPGPNILSVIGTSMGAGRRDGAMLALGIGLGAFGWGLLTLAGLSTLIRAYAAVVTTIKIAGGAYLLWLAFKAFKSAASRVDPKFGAIKNAAPAGPWRLLLRGLVIQLTNPKAALTWIAIVSLGVRGEAPRWVGLSIVLGTGVLSILGHLGYALLFSTRSMAAVYAKARRAIEAFLGFFFCFAGVKLLASRP
jgi:amino acid exporter